MRLIGLYCFRHDAQLVTDLEQNIAFCDDVIAYDDRQRDGDWYHEGSIRRRLLDSAREARADWVLCVDPDERFESCAGPVIRKLIEFKQRVIYRFHFREMFTNSSYRVDGIWGDKTKDILFPLLPERRHMNLRVHSQWAPVNRDYRVLHTGLNLYHLKMIDPANRIARSHLYERLDVGHEIQSQGYEYLCDESGMCLEQIPPGREFTPAYRADYAITQF